ncbi:hypothetical protein C8R45DRAFT_1086422 [Mycena sanguinolenta]|nr:hypothetical protein C8R45DRAFT_1086422 [Mycena sanguinolenta]
MLSPPPAPKHSVALQFLCNWSSVSAPSTSLACPFRLEYTGISFTDLPLFHCTSPPVTHTTCRSIGTPLENDVLRPHDNDVWFAALYDTQPSGKGAGADTPCRARSWSLPRRRRIAFALWPSHRVGLDEVEVVGGSRSRPQDRELVGGAGTRVTSLMSCAALVGSVRVARRANAPARSQPGVHGTRY